MNFTGCDLLLGGAVEAELADAETAFDLERRAEEAAGHGTGSIEVAEAGGGVESWAGLVVGKVIEERGAGVVDDAGIRVAGKLRGEAGDGLFGAGANGCGASRIGRCERGESIAEAGGIEGRDGEDADAALGATGSALQPGAGAAGGIGDGGVDDLNELRVAGGHAAFRITKTPRR
jgi:hypothetical protein